MSDFDSSSKPSEIQLWGFEGVDVRIHDREGNAWFIATDVCKAWEIKNVSHAVSTLDEDEKATIVISDSVGRQNTLLIISESGVYAMAARSRKEKPKRFCKWVRAEVVPTLRKTGTFTMPGTEPKGATPHHTLIEALVTGQTMIAKTLAAIGGVTAEVKQDVAEVKQDVAEVKQVVEIQAQQIEELKKLAPIPGYMTLAGFSSLKGIRPSREEMGFWGKRLGSHCRTHSVERIPVPDQRYGKVYSYPLTVLEATFATLGPR